MATEIKPLTVDEKLDAMNKRLKRIQLSTDIQTAIAIIGFLGIITLGSLLKGDAKGTITGK